MQPPEEEHPGRAPSLREEVTAIARTRILLALTILIDALFLGVVIPILALLEWVREYFHLAGLSAWFVMATEVVLTLGTLAAVAFYVFLDMRIAFRRLRAAGQEDRHDRA